MRLPPLSSHPQRRSHTHPKIARNPPDPGPRRSRRDDRRDLIRGGILQPPAAELEAIGLGPAQTGHDALPDHRAFKFGEHPQHLKHRPARRRRRAEALLVQEQVNALRVCPETSGRIAKFSEHEAN
jgi:hypothetical protein